MNQKEVYILIAIGSGSVQNAASAKSEKEIETMLAKAGKGETLSSAELATLDKLYDNVAGYSYAEDWKAFREQEKQEASVRYMIVDNGKNSYVKADRQVFTSSNIHNRAVALENYLNSKIDHTGYLEIPTADGDAIRITNNEDTIRRNAVGKLTSFDEYIDENGSWDKSSILLKQNIALHIDEVIAVSRPTNERRSDNGYKHDEFAQKGWSYRTAYFQDYDGSYYRVKISIAENDSGKVAYNVNKFRKRNEAFSGKITGSSFSGAQNRESFNGGIASDSSENVKKNFSLNDNTGRELSNAQQYMFSIAEGMSDIERYNELKDAKLLVKDYSASDVEHLTEAEVRALEDKVKQNVRKSVKKLVEKFGVIKHYSNSNANIEFNFSKNGASESINKQGERSGDFLSMGKMFASFDSIVESAVPIEIHGDKYKGTIREDPGLKRVYVLVSAYYDNGIVPVQLEVKEFSVDRESQLYVAVTAKKIEADVIVPGLRQNAAPGTVTSFDVSIADILSEINPSDGDFLKYVPDQFLSDAQKASKKEALNIERDRIDRIGTFSIDHDLLREMDGYNTHGDAVGKQGKAVEKMFVQAFKEATQGKEASLDVYPDTLIAFDKLLPKLRKFVDGTLTDKSVEQLTDELVGIVDKALKYAKGEKKAQPLIESYVGGAITTYAPDLFI